MKVSRHFKIRSISDEAGVFCFIFFLIGFFGSFTLGLEALFPQPSNPETLGVAMLFATMVLTASILFGYAGIVIDAWIRHHVKIFWIKWLFVTLPNKVKRRL